MKFSAVKALSLTFALLAIQVQFAHATGVKKEWIPQDAQAVLESLPARASPTKVRPQASTQNPTQAPKPNAAQTSVRTPDEAYKQALAWIQQARATSDPRFLGRAEAVLSPWWGQSHSPANLSILQATIEQSRHEFESAKKTLLRALEKEPAQPQAWLTLATIERVAANYPAAAQACSQVERYGAVLYAQACQLETASLLGRFDEVRVGFEKLITQSSDQNTLAWLQSLKGENEERAGRSSAALKAYQASLAQEDDSYTALALADLLLRQKQAKQALAALEKQPNSDAVLIRQAYAQKLLGQSNWRVLKADIDARFAALQARGEDAKLHGRELALSALWLDDDAAKALPFAQANLQNQREPLDWWLALTSASQTKQGSALTDLVARLTSTGLKDARLATWSPQLAR